MVFYLEIWAERPHICQCCGKPLGDKPLNWMFDHILEKGDDRYAHLRHEKANICLLCKECHDLKNAIHLSPRLMAIRKFTLDLFSLSEENT